MVAKGRGGGKTPERVVTLLQEEVAKSSQAATSRATGLTLQTVQRYIKGIGEPSQTTLEKLADYFKVSVAELRGEPRTFTYANLIGLGGRDKIFEYLAGQGLPEKNAMEITELVIERREENLRFIIDEIDKYPTAELPVLFAIIKKFREDEKFCKILKKWLDNTDHPPGD